VERVAQRREQPEAPPANRWQQQTLEPDMTAASTAAEPKKKLNSRWRKGAVRYSSDRTVEHTRYVRQADGSRRRKTDAPTERVFVDRLRDADGFRNGARVMKRGN
jgi:hypothetical protein